MIDSPRVIEFVETKLFSDTYKAIAKPKELLTFQRELAVEPKMCLFFAGSSGIRKAFLKGGKVGSVKRAIYFALKDDLVYLLLAQKEAVEPELTEAELHQICKIKSVLGGF